MKKAFMMFALMFGVAGVAACTVQSDEPAAQTSVADSDLQAGTDSVAPRCNMVPGLYYECESQGVLEGIWYKNASTCHNACNGQFCTADLICHTDCTCEPN